MAEAREFVVACWRCSGRAEVLLDITNAGTTIYTEPGACPECHGTGLIRIRALPADIPTIERVPEDV